MICMLMRQSLSVLNVDETKFISINDKTVPIKKNKKITLYKLNMSVILFQELVPDQRLYLQHPQYLWKDVYNLE